MNIVVCIKQVPDVDDIKWTKENNLDRSNMLSKINMYDEWAMDYALKIKSQFKDVTITAISMGPTQASEVLFQALAKGANRAILLSDKAFSGSDTIITAKILAAGILKYVPDYDLILTGNIAQDGDTAQVPVSLAQLLSIPDVTNVVEIHNADKKMAIVSQKLDTDVNMFEVLNPSILAIKKECDIKVEPRIDDYVRAQNTLIEIYGAQDLGISPQKVGIIGSPTMVHKAFRPQINKETKEITEDFSRSILNLILKAKQ